MADIYDDDIEFVQDALEEFGGDASLVVAGTVTGESFPGAGDGTVGDPTLYPMKALEEEFTFKEMNGGSVQENDLKIMTTDPGVATDISDTVRWAGRDWQVVQVKPFRPDGVTEIFYRWHLR